jgi:hypothetical protein
MVATEQIKLQARLAGAEVKDGPRRRRKGEDPYGDMLARRQKMKALGAEFQKDPAYFKKYMKPL